MENGNEDTRKGGRAARRHGHSHSIVRLHRARGLRRERDRRRDLRRRALKAFEALMTANDIIIRSAFYYILLPSLFAMALPLLLYELLELHDRRRL